MADRKVDRLRCGGPSWEAVEPAVSEALLRVEYRAVLDGLARCSLAELRAPPETFEAPLSGLGSDSPVALPDGLPVGVPGCSGTVCGICETSAASSMAPSGKVSDTGGGGGGGGAATNDTATGEGNAGGTVSGGLRSASPKGVELATAAPGFRMGNSSSSIGLGMGMGPEMRPRTVWWPVLGLAVVESAGRLPLAKILGFIVSSTGVAGLTLRAARGKLRTDDDKDEEVSMFVMWEVDIGGGRGGLSEPSGITIK